MQLRNTPERYGMIAQTLHWAVVVLVLLGWALGTFIDAFTRGPAQNAALFVHMSAGLAIIAIVVVRLLWRAGNPPPLREKTALGAWSDRASVWVHYLLYGLLIATPAVGIVVRFAGGEALPVFGLFDIASPWLRDRAFLRAVKEVHQFLANGLVILAGLHMAAALFHHWVLRDGTLRRMLPGPAQ
jgi:cytochrome b561